MAKQTINLGTPPAGTDGDTVRTGFSKANANFTELYDSVALKADKTFVDNGLGVKADKTYVDNGLAGKMPANPGQGQGNFIRGDGSYANRLLSMIQSQVAQSNGIPGFEYHVPGAQACMTYLLSDGVLVFANSNGSGAWISTRATLTSSGSMNLNGSLSQGSDMRIKANIQTIDDALAKVRGIRGVRYQKMLPSTAPYGDDGGAEMPPSLGPMEIGVIAQEVLAVCPEAVSVPDESTGTLAVAYGNLVGLVIQAVNELAAKHDALDQQLQAALARIEALESA